MLILTKSNWALIQMPPTQNSQTTFKPNLTCIFLSVRARYIISKPDGRPCTFFFRERLTPTAILQLENNSFFNALSRNWDNLLLEDVAKMQCAAVHVLLSKYHSDISKFYLKFG